MLEFKEFNRSFVEQAVSLTLKEYNEECCIVDELPKNNYEELMFNLLSDMTDHKLGVVALDGSNVVGFMTCYAPIENFFGRVKGAFSPIHAHGVIKKDRNLIYSQLYQRAAKKWVDEGILSHGIALYAHNNVAIESFFHNGFGLRCMDAITSIDRRISELKYIEGLKMEEISLDKIDCLLPLKNNLISHMCNSPIFIPCSKFDMEKFINQAIARKSRFFTASYEGKVIGYIETTESGENFTCDDQETINICGAYLSLEYRGRGIFDLLLSFVFKQFQQSSYKCCGVDFESINPTAKNFWTKYFTPYTYSMVRRIDERINSSY